MPSDSPTKHQRPNLAHVVPLSREQLVAIQRRTVGYGWVSVATTREGCVCFWSSMADGEFFYVSKTGNVKGPYRA